MSLVNTLTLSVDTENLGAPTDQVYTRYDEKSDKTTYIRADHTVVARRELSLARRPSTRSGNYNGSSKGTVKFTDSVTVAGVDGADVSALLIMDLSISIPVGCTDAQILEMRQRLIAALDDDTFIGPFMTRLEI